MVARLTAILLLWCSMLASLSGFLVIAGFELNRSYIATNLCVNRNKPELHCNGRCYLMRKLKQAEEKEQKQERQLTKIQLQQPLTPLQLFIPQYPLTALLYSVPLCTGVPVTQVNNIFHPPQSS